MMINTDQYTRFFEQGQAAVRTTVEAWTRTVTSAVGQALQFADTFDVESAVDRCVEFNQQVLEAQRDLAERLLAAGAAVAAAATRA
jgi:hypothetical protein